MKGFIRLTSVLMIFCLIFCTPLSVLAKSESISLQSFYTIYEDESVVITAYEDDNGNAVIMEFVDDTLTQRNTINRYGGTISREIIGANGNSFTLLNVSDYVTINETPKNNTYSVNASVDMGSIVYRRLDESSSTGSYTYYGIDCSYVPREIGSTTYTVNSFVGKVTDLVSLLVGAFDIPLVMASQYIQALLVALGITIVAGVITQAFSDTVSCIETEYKWTLVNIRYPSITSTVYGYSYYITDVKSNLQGQTYYEGYTPNRWGTQSLAVELHNEMFPYTVWEVASWL